MANAIKVGDKVMMDTEETGSLGKMLYEIDGVVPGETYTVVGTEPDEDPTWNEQYGGYLTFEGNDFPYFVMTDFKVVARNGRD